MDTAIAFGALFVVAILVIRAEYRREKASRLTLPRKPGLLPETYLTEDPALAARRCAARDYLTANGLEPRYTDAVRDTEAALRAEADAKIAEEAERQRRAEVAERALARNYVAREFARLNSTWPEVH